MLGDRLRMQTHVGDDGVFIRSMATRGNLGGLARATGDAALVLDLPESSDPSSSFEAGYRLTEDLLRQKRPFTALMAFDDMTALGAVRALGKAGIRVPEQCSVIGFDDVAPSSLVTPSLTTVRQPMAEMGKMAVSIVSEGITAVQQKTKIMAQHRKLTPELVIRDSTCKPT